MTPWMKDAAYRTVLTFVEAAAGAYGAAQIVNLDDAKTAGTVALVAGIAAAVAFVKAVAAKALNGTAALVPHKTP